MRSTTVADQQPAASLHFSNTSASINRLLSVHQILFYSPFHPPKQLPQLGLSASPFQRFGIVCHPQSEKHHHNVNFAPTEGTSFLTRLRLTMATQRLCIVVVTDNEFTAPLTKPVSAAFIAFKLFT